MFPATTLPNHIGVIWLWRTAYVRWHARSKSDEQDRASK